MTCAVYYQPLRDNICTKILFLSRHLSSNVCTLWLNNFEHRKCKEMNFKIRNIDDSMFARLKLGITICSNFTRECWNIGLKRTLDSKIFTAGARLGRENLHAAIANPGRNLGVAGD